MVGGRGGVWVGRGSLQGRGGAREPCLGMAVDRGRTCGGGDRLFAIGWGEDIK